MDSEHQPQCRKWKAARSGGEAGGAVVFWGCYTQSCPTLQPHDCSPTGSSDRGIFQVRILEWAAISCCRGSSRPKDGIRISFLWSPASAGERFPAPHVPDGSVPTHSSFLKPFSSHISSPCLFFLGVGPSYSVCGLFVHLLTWTYLLSEWFSFGPSPTKFQIHGQDLFCMFTHLHTFGQASCRFGIYYL